ncbi:hypothetical protein Tco_1143592 [Tanacetum coccineum]
MYPPPQQFTPFYASPIHHQYHHTPVNPQQHSIFPQPFISPSVTQQSQAEFPQLDTSLVVLMFQLGEDPIECINKAMAFLSAVTSRFSPLNNQLRTSSNPKNQASIQDGRVTVQQHMARQRTQPKRPRNATWFKEKLMLAKAQEEAFQTEDLDAYDSDCDDISLAKAVLMANLSSYDSDVLSEVPDSDTYLNDIINQDVQEIMYSEQTHIVDFLDNEITSDIIIISYSQYLQESQNAGIQDTNSFALNDLLVLSLVEQMTDHVANLDKENQTNKMVNESLTAELERYKERVAIFEQRLNVDLNKREKLIDSQMDDLIRNRNAKFAAFQQEIDTLKETLSNQVKEKESLSTTLTIFKTECKEKESKYMDKEIVLENQNKELENTLCKLTSFLVKTFVPFESLFTSSYTVRIEVLVNFLSRRNQQKCNQENKIDLEKKIKELDNIIYKVGQSAQTVHMLTKPQAFYDNIHKQALGYQNPFYLKKAQRIKPTLYDGVVISNTHVAMPVIDDEETLILEDESRSKMSEKAKDPEVIAKKISHKPIDYEKLNRLSEDFKTRFTPQQELSAEQAFWFHILNPTIEPSYSPPVIVDVPSELPKVSLVNASLKKLKFHLAQFDSVVKKRTTPSALEEGEWGFEHTRTIFNNEIIPFLKSLKDIFNVFDKDLLNEITEVQTVFDQMEAVVQQSSVDKQCVEIAKKELLLENDRLLHKIMSQDVLITVMNSMFVNMEMEICKSCDKRLHLDAEFYKSKQAYNDLLKSHSQLERHCISLENALEIPEYFEKNDLKAQLQDRDMAIYKLKDIIKSMREKSKDENDNYDLCELETKNVQVENSVAKLLSENERLCKKINHVKQVFKDQFNSIKKTRVRTKEQSDSLIDQLNLKSAENEDLKAQIQDKVFVITSLKNNLRKLKGKETVANDSQIPSATTIAPGMFKLDLVPLAPKLLQNRDAHIDYLRTTQEHANILREIVEQAKEKQPLDTELDFACKHATRIQELLIYVRDTCPNAIKPSAKKVAVTPLNKVKKVRFAEPLTSSNDTKQVESSKTSDSNTPVLSSTGVKCSTSNYGSKPPGNKKNDRISQKPSRNMKNKVEAQPRKVNKKNRVVEPICDVDVKHSCNTNSVVLCVTCKKSMFDGVHDKCLLDFVKNGNNRAKSAKKHKIQNV